MDINDMRVLVTLASFISFGGIAVWACWPSHRADFEAAAQLPFSGEEPQS
ncbi:cbb3-type cytochrome c oxidase subunit 3 [Aquabacterium sp.]|nr:cbb3-type cytochrome c oxidase subunit 3 [Aquabacterium sp.]MBC7701012.1 cbb3-type cytochrome c oxidase subunit 3 [Aquabacterium sp.]